MSEENTSEEVKVGNNEGVITKEHSPLEKYDRDENEDTGQSKETGEEVTKYVVMEAGAPQESKEEIVQSEYFQTIHDSETNQDEHHSSSPDSTLYAATTNVQAETTEVQAYKTELQLELTNDVHEMQTGDTHDIQSTNTEGIQAVGMAAGMQNVKAATSEVKVDTPDVQTNSTVVQTESPEVHTDSGITMAEARDQPGDVSTPESSKEAMKLEDIDDTEPRGKPWDVEEEIKTNFLGTEIDVGSEQEQTRSDSVNGGKTVEKRQEPIEITTRPEKPGSKKSNLCAVI